MDEQGSPIIFEENSQEVMRITAEGHRWLLCEHGWKYCTTCDGWPCGEPQRVKTYCEECAEALGSQFKPPVAKKRWIWDVIFFLAGVGVGLLIAL